QARLTGLYNQLSVGDMVAMLRDREADASADLVFAADALVYLPDLAPLFRQVRRVLTSQALFAFTVETHAGDGVILGASLRYQHGKAYLRDQLAAAAFALLALNDVSTRDESGKPVPGLVAVAAPSVVRGVQAREVHL